MLDQPALELPPFAWTDDNVGALRKLWTEGLSASQIAFRIGQGVTRNAVLGKVDRLNLEKRIDPSLPRQKAARSKPRRARNKPQPCPIALRVSEFTYLSPIEKKILSARLRHEADALPIEPPPQPRGDKPGVVAIKSNECRWPFGDPRDWDNFHFCGAKQKLGSSYCHVHALLARADVQPRARNVIPSLKRRVA